jgi:DNA (cytosine-5)-methyltransferase 1
MLRAIREVQPRWVVGENVRGLTNWNGGLVFDEVQADLENEGYEVTPYLLPACAVNAPHRRDRIWFVAYCNEGATRPPGTSGGAESKRGNNDAKPELWGEQAEQHIGRCKFLWDAANADSVRQDVCQCDNEKHSGKGRFNAQYDFEPNGDATDLHKEGLERSARQIIQRSSNGPSGPCNEVIKTNGGYTNWQQFPTQSPVRGRNDGISDGLVGITFSKHREKSIGAYGNAIVPQVALQIFKAIQEYENLNNA